MERRQPKGWIISDSIKKGRQVIDKKGENLVKKLISQKNENGFYS